MPLLWHAGPASAVLLAAASLGHSPHLHLYLTPLAAAPIAGVTLAAHLAALHRPDLAESNWTNAAAATIVAVPIDTPGLVAAAARAIGSARIG